MKIKRWGCLLSFHHIWDNSGQNLNSLFFPPLYFLQQPYVLVLPRATDDFVNTFSLGKKVFALNWSWFFSLFGCFGLLFFDFNLVRTQSTGKSFCSPITHTKVFFRSFEYLIFPQLKWDNLLHLIHCTSPVLADAAAFWTTIDVADCARRIKSSKLINSLSPSLCSYEITKSQGNLYLVDIRNWVTRNWFEKFVPTVISSQLFPTNKASCYDFPDCSNR